MIPAAGAGSRPVVLVASPVFPPARGGIETLAHRLASELTRIRPQLVVLDEPGAREFDAASPLAIRRVRNEPRGGRRSLARLNAAVLAEARRLDPDLILSMYVTAAPAALLLRRALGVPFVQYVHAKEVVGWPELSRLALPRAARVVVVSRYTAALAREFGAPAQRLVRIPPGVDLPAPGVAAERSDRPTMVTIARLDHRYKGHDVLLEALERIRERVPDVLWVVIGDGRLRAELERRARERGLSRSVHVAGVVSDVERDAWLSRADLFAMPSRIPPNRYGGEGFGIVYLEAGARGLPVVAGRAGGATDAVVDGETGLLVDPEDPAAVADAVTELLLDGERARRMGLAGRQRAERLAWPSIARRVEDELLKAVPPCGS